MPEGARAVTATSAPGDLLVEALKGRKTLRFQAPVANTQNCYLNHSKQVESSGKNKGLELPPGGLISLNYMEDPDIEEGWYAIAASGTQEIIVNEYF